MADERCVFPGDNPRPPGRWLDRDAAERLLRGEPLEAVDAEARNQVDQLAGALAALAAEPTLSSAELPGEAAALAAFRKVRADRHGEVEQLAPRGRTHPVSRITSHPSDAGLVRLGRPDSGGRRARWGRPTRLGLAAALAAGMIGGVAVAAGTGMLPTPFGEDKPGPAASVTAAATPERPVASPSPGAPDDGDSRVPAPGGATDGPSVDGSSKDEAGGGATSGQQGSDAAGESGRTGEWWRQTRSSCQDVLDGKDLDAGRRSVLEDAAGGGGNGQLKTYCNGILDRTDTGDDGRDDAKDSAGNTSSGADTRSDQDSDPEDGGGDDDGNHIFPLLPVLPGTGDSDDGRDDDGRNDDRGHDAQSGDDLGGGDLGAGASDNDGTDNGNLGNDGILTPSSSPSASQSPSPTSSSPSTLARLLPTSANTA